MRNLFVLGSGRSGTSAVAALFRNEPGIFYGYDVLEPSVSNPTGYYECEVVNTLNNALLRQITGVSLLDLLPSWLLPWVENRFPWPHRDTRSLWLACPKRPLRWRMSYDIAHLIGRMARHQPFCFKDPRFGFTLPLWRPYLPEDVRFLAVFRDPAATVSSIMKDAVALYGDRRLPITREWAIDHWKLIYENIIRQQQSEPDRWMFVDFSGVISGESVEAIRVFSEADLDLNHLDPSKSTSAQRLEDSVGEECRRLFADLRHLAKRDSERLTGGVLTTRVVV